MSYLTFSSQEKHHFFTLFVLKRASDNTTSLNIGGTNAWAVPPPQIFGGPFPPVPPRSPPLTYREGNCPSSEGICPCSEGICPGRKLSVGETSEGESVKGETVLHSVMLLWKDTYYCIRD